MSKAKKFSWIVGPKSLLSLIGAEYELLRKAGGNVMLKFYTASATIVLIAFTSMVSIVYLVELMFHSRIAEVILSILITGLFILMYIFLILTISNNAGRKTIFSIANITRFGFVIFMAMMIAKPLELYIFREPLREELQAYKENSKNDHAGKIKSQFSEEILSCERKLQYYRKNNTGKIFDEDIGRLDSIVATLKAKESKLISAAYAMIDKSDYFIQQLRLLHVNHPSTWGITALLVLVFLLPGYLIFSISRDNTYYPLKEEYEKRIVSREYLAFTNKYTQIFQTRHGIEKVYYTRYEDPPFNTVRKPAPVYEASDAFFERYS